MSAKRSADARALTARAGTAHVAIAVDTRPKRVRPRKGRGSFRRAASKVHDDRNA